MMNRKFMVPLIMAATVTMAGCGSTSIPFIRDNVPLETEQKAYIPQKIDVSKYIDSEDSSLQPSEDGTVAATVSNLKAKPSSDGVANLPPAEEGASSASSASSVTKDLSYFEGNLGDIRIPADHVRMSVVSSGQMAMAMTIESIDESNMMLDMSGVLRMMVCGGKIYLESSTGGTKKQYVSSADADGSMVSSVSSMGQQVPSALTSISSVLEKDDCYELTGSIADSWDDTASLQGTVSVDKESNAIKRIEYDSDGSHYCMDIQAAGSLSLSPSDFEGAEEVSADELSMVFTNAFMGMSY